MEKNANSKTRRSSISDVDSYEEIGKFWDAHSLDDPWDETREVEFQVSATQRRRVALEPQIYKDLETEARLRGVVPEALANLWLNEKLHPSK